MVCTTDVEGGAIEEHYRIVGIAPIVEREKSSRMRHKRNHGNDRQERPMRLPSADEINVFDSLDERHAVKVFLGKDLQQAEAIFRENFLYYQEDLMWMGPKAFVFYVPAVLNYLRSADSDGDADAARSFCSLIEFRLDWEAGEIADARAILREGILAILERFDRYGCDLNIDGDVAGRYRVLLSRLEA
jgi:hypothetical protein